MLVNDRNKFKILHPAFISLYALVLVGLLAYFSKLDLNLIHSIFYYSPIKHKIIQFTGEYRYVSFITKASKENKNKILLCWYYKEKVENAVENGYLRHDTIQIDSFTSHLYFLDNKLVKIYFVGKSKTRIEETNYYFRNDSMILGRYYVYIDSFKSMREINTMKPLEIYTSFIHNDTVIYEAQQHPTTSHPKFNYLAIREYEHANCITLNKLKLPYPCPNALLPK